MVLKTARHITRNGYNAFDWINRSELFLLPTLWQQFPVLVLGKYLVNTSFDSGFLTLSPAEREEGWHMVGNLAHSPRIERLDQIPHDQFDEWLAFDDPTRVDNFETLVNHYGFTPVDWDWDQQRWWDQLSRLNPLHVLGENDNLYLVTRDESIVQQILNLNRSET